MKRSNRLVLLVGVFLAIVAFLAVLLLRPGTPTQSEVKTTQATVIATQDIPLGARITAEQVTVEEKPLEGRDTDAFGDVSQVIGQKVRQPVTTGQAITQRTLYPSKEARDAALQTGMTDGMAATYDRLDAYLATLV